MSITAVASETKASALLAECRRCLAFGLTLSAPFIKDVIDQMENASVTDTSARANLSTVNSISDGRSTAEQAAVDA